MLFYQCELVFSSFICTTSQEYFFPHMLGLFLYCFTVKPRFLWPGLHIGLCVEAALLWVTPCCHSAPTTLKGQHEGNYALTVEGGSRGYGEIPVISPEVLDSPRVSEWCCPAVVARGDSPGGFSGLGSDCAGGSKSAGSKPAERCESKCEVRSPEECECLGLPLTQT